jgi:hypothetical protein
MLQRIQSLLLLVVAVCMFVFLGTQTWHKTGNGEEAIVSAYALVHMKGALAAVNEPIYYLAVLAVLSAGLSIFTIFQYKNRVRQMLFVALNSLLAGATLAVAVYHINFEANLFFNPEQQGQFGIGFWALFIALIANWFANRFIRRDEKMVKSADRMR